MWIVKIGGSWITNPKLTSLISRLEDKREGTIIVVAGGGCFADSIRFAYKKTSMTEKLANILALKSTEFFCYYLKEINANCHITPYINKIKKNCINIWLPSLILSNEKSFINSWESTSDSVAAWVTMKKKADGLIYIKSLRRFEKLNKLKNLQKKNIIDKNTSIYLKSYSGLIKIIGLNIIEILNKQSNWKTFIKELSTIKL